MKTNKLILLSLSTALSTGLLLNPSVFAQKAPAPTKGKLSKVNPASFGQFCPPGYEIVNKQNTQKISLAEQAHVEKIVKLFLHLETALASKVHWHSKRGRSNAAYRNEQTDKVTNDYWAKGVTEKFYGKDKELPFRGDLFYRDARYTNICMNAKEVMAILLIDVAAFGVFREPDHPEVKEMKGQAFASNRFWTADDKKPYKIGQREHEYIDWTMPKNAIVYMPIPLKKPPEPKPWQIGLLPDVPWVIAQSTVPYLLHLGSMKKLFIEYLDERTVSNRAQVDKQLKRPAWSVEQ